MTQDSGPAGPFSWKENGANSVTEFAPREWRAKCLI